jgi:hypothetical protein
MDGPQARRAQPGWSDRQTGSRRDKIPEKLPPLAAARDFEVCHSLAVGHPEEIHVKGWINIQIHGYRTG